jgi:predicted HAD superfamily Cof-like phosphohydrolase
MAVPWLAVGTLVLTNLDKIMNVVKPGFTRKKVEVASAQFDLLNQQIAELQSAASTNAEQISQLAAQVKEVVEALAQAGANAAAERAMMRRLVTIAITLAVVSIALGVWALVG